LAAAIDFDPDVRLPALQRKRPTTSQGRKAELKCTYW
jgi:hypothetical protein